MIDLCETWEVLVELVLMVAVHQNMALLMKSECCFSQWLGAEWVTGHYLNQ